MNPIVFAMRRPITVMVLVAAVALGSILALTRMSIDIFPNLNLPVIYVCQPYGGMDPAQMEGLLTNYASDFEDLDQLGMVRFVAGQAWETVVERTAAHTLLERIRAPVAGIGAASGSA